MRQWKTFDLKMNNQTKNDTSFQTTISDNIFSTSTSKSTFPGGTSFKESVETEINVFKVIEKQNSSLDSQ